MIIKIKAKNIRIFNEIEIDFLIKSKKSGINVKENDFIKTKNNKKIQKKIGIIGSNASGKTSFLNVFIIFLRYFNIGKLKDDINAIIFNNILNSKINENIKGLKKKTFTNETINNNFLEVSNFIIKNNEYMLKEFRYYYEWNYNSFCYDSNIDEIYFEVEHIFESKIITRKFYIRKSGDILLKKYDENNKKIDEYKLNFFDNSINVNTILSRDQWMFLLIDIPFNGKFDFGLNNPYNFQTTTYNRNIITFIFDYIRHSGKGNHFLKWLRLADSSIDDLIFDYKNKIFSIKKIDHETINLDSLSLGTKKWLLLYYFIYIYFPESKISTKIIIFDEIENSFHEQLIRVLLEIIDGKKDIQLIFSTHNPNIFDETYRHDGIYLTDYKNSKYKINRLDEYKLRKDKVVSSMYWKEEIGNHPDSQYLLDFLNDDSQ